MSQDKIIADAKSTNWVDRFAPSLLRPLLKLGRFDRPIGTWLLLWPCWWGVALAIPHEETASFTDQVLIVKDHVWFLFLFVLGALVMRGAGCAYNDLVDRDFDRLVKRTQRRPLASGQVTIREGWLFFAVLVMMGFLVLLRFNAFTILLGASVLILVGIYPFMKRVTYWPQLFLGLAFNWGALMGWAAVTGTLSLEAVLLYIGGVFWTLGYDTIYAHQDKTDDILIGVKSTALKFGENTHAWVFIFYGMATGFFILAGYLTGLHAFYYFGIIIIIFLFRTQLKKLDIHNPESCLAVFKSNMYVGMSLFVFIMLTKIF